MQKILHSRRVQRNNRPKHFVIRSSAGDSSHNVHLCVDTRSAEEYSLKRLNCIFEEKLYFDNVPFVYSCCVSGDFFDKRADDSRTKLNLVDDKYDLRSSVEGQKQLHWTPYQLRHWSKRESASGADESVDIGTSVCERKKDGQNIITT